MDRHQVSEVNGRVYLSGCERGVAEQFLDRAKVHAGFQEMGGNGVAKGMGVEIKPGSRKPNGDIQDPSNGAVGKAAPTLIHKQGVIAPTSQSTPYGPFGQVCFKSRFSAGSVGNDSFLSSLSAHPKKPRPPLKIAQVQRHQLSDP